MRAFVQSLLIVSALSASSAIPAAPTGEAGWRRLADGLEWRVMEGGASSRRGSTRVAVVRAETSRHRLEPFCWTEDPSASQGLDIDAWQKRTGAAAIFNAGQYYPDRTPMGLFLKDGRNLGTRQLKTWKGLLVAEPKPAQPGRPDGATARTAPRARVIDLQHESLALTDAPWRFVVQSFMLLDRLGGKRVRRSDWLANRTVVATDRRGRLLVIHTEGGWSLWDLADWIARSDLLVQEAMSMDGGFESQLCVRAGGLEYLSFGQWHVDDRGDHSFPGLRVGLPAVIGLFPRR